MKTYVIILSQTFPKGHAREGEPTCFKEKFLQEQQTQCCPAKIHTIRANYDLWEKRFLEIEKGNACLSVRQWTGKPYRSKQVELARLTNADGIGLQKLTVQPVETITARFFLMGKPTIIGYRPCFDIHELAKNDGLDLEDFRKWFVNYDYSKPMAIIHFTNFRY